MNLRIILLFKYCFKDNTTSNVYLSIIQSVNFSYTQARISFPSRPAKVGPVHVLILRKLNADVDGRDIARRICVEICKPNHIVFTTHRCGRTSMKFGFTQCSICLFVYHVSYMILYDNEYYEMNIMIMSLYKTVDANCADLSKCRLLTISD